MIKIDNLFLRFWAEQYIFGHPVEIWFSCPKINEILAIRFDPSTSQALIKIVKMKNIQKVILLLAFSLTLKSVACLSIENQVVFARHGLQKIFYSGRDFDFHQQIKIRWN